MSFKSNVTTCSCPRLPTKSQPAQPPTPPPATIHLSPGLLSSPNSFFSSSYTAIPKGTAISISSPRLPNIRALELSSPIPPRITLPRYLRMWMGTKMEHSEYGISLILHSILYILFGELLHCGRFCGYKLNASSLATDSTVLWIAIACVRSTRE